MRRMDIKINIERKHLLILIVILAIATVINYTIGQIPSGEQGHAAAEVYPGTFQTGDYVLPGNLSVSDNLTAGTICLGGDCQSSWPAGGGEFVILTSPGSKCSTACAAYGGCAFGANDGGGFVDKLVDCDYGASPVPGWPEWCACWPS